VREPQSRGVQHLARRVDRRWRVSVHALADQRMAVVCRLCPDLVLSAGLERQLEERRTAECLDDAVAGHGVHRSRPPARGDTLPECA
jgi:hypothetical protein